jgi:hypothetical protein
MRLQECMLDELADFAIREQRATLGAILLGDGLVHGASAQPTTHEAPRDAIEGVIALALRDLPRGRLGRHGGCSQQGEHGLGERSQGHPIR